MNNRKIVVLSVGMLIDVNIQKFMTSMIAKAMAVNPQFDVKAVMQPAMLLAKKFNLGKLKTKEFATQMLQLLGIKNVSIKQFYGEWNKMLNVTGLKRNLDALHSRQNNSDVLYYFVSDTNFMHFKSLIRHAKRMHVTVRQVENGAEIDGMPLLLSFKLGKSRQHLVEAALQKIASSEQNKDADVTVVFGAPSNHTNSKMKELAKFEVGRIKQVCAKYKASLVKHHGDLPESLDKVLGVSTPTQTYNHTN